MRPLMNDSRLYKAPKELMRMQQGGEFANTLQLLADQFLNVERVRRRGFFQYEDIHRIRRACRRSYHPEAAMRLWTAIVTEIWAEIYLDSRGRHPQTTQIARSSSAWLEQASPAWG
jgi:hypothetical protein